MVTESIEHLMRLAQKGDQDAYNRVLIELSTKLSAYINKRVYSEEDREEILQMVLLKIHMYKHTYDPSKALLPWAYTVTKNILIDFYKKHTRKEVNSLPEYEEIESSYIDGHSTLQFKQAFLQLTKEQQKAIYMTKVKGLSLEEGANEQGISLSAMKVRVHRSLKAFKEHFVRDKSIDQEDK